MAYGLEIPEKFYQTEKKPLHVAGYTLALGLIVVGVAETVHGVYYRIKNKGGSIASLLLGPETFIAGAGVAYLYLRQAGVVGGISDLKDYQS